MVTFAGDNSPPFFADFSTVGEKNASMSSKPAESLRPVSLTINPVFLILTKKSHRL